MPELNYDAASQAAMNLRGALLPITYALAFLGWGFAVWRASNLGESVVKYFILAAIVVILTAGFPTALMALRDGIRGLAADNSAHTSNQFYLMLNARLTNEPSMFNVGATVLYGIVKFLQGIGLAGVAIVDLLQNLSVLALVAVSPILLGMLATPVTQTAGLRFLLLSCTVSLWPIGTQLVDLILYGVGAHVFAIALGAGAAGAAGAIGTATAAGISLTTVALPALVICMAFAAFVPIALYLAVPIFFHVVMQGGSPVTAALSSAMGIGATAMGISGMAASRSIATAGGLASRAPAGAATSSMPAGGNGSSAPPVPSVTPPSTVTGGASTPGGSGVVQTSGGAFAAATGAAPTPSPVGSQFAAPGGGMTAQQTAASTFNVTTASGATRTFTGSAGNPTTLARAFNNMMASPPNRP
jgi:hypothetical protein